MRGAAATLATVATAVSGTTFRAQAVEGYDWDVTNWNAGCAVTGCYYDFNVSGPADNNNPARPAFLASCSGSGENGAYEECELLDEASVQRRVVAKLLTSTSSNSSGTVAHIQVSFKYIDLEEASTWWNFTGTGDTKYNQLAAPLDFTIKPDSITAAA